MQSRSQWVLTHDKSELAPEGWTHPEAGGQDVSILAKRNQTVSTLQGP
jgi:hypothetical protein